MNRTTINLGRRKLSHADKLAAKRQERAEHAKVFNQGERARLMLSGFCAFWKSINARHGVGSHIRRGRVRAHNIIHEFTQELVA